jgi:hypothetical protein
MAERFARLPARAAGMHLPGRHLSVLIAIAAHANAAGGCAFLSLATIAKLVRIDRSRVPPLVRKLEEVGLLRKLPPSGARRTTTYEVVFDPTAIGAAERRSRDASGTSTGKANGNNTGDVSGTSTDDAQGNSILTESLNIIHEQKATPVFPNIEELFERFWKAYPSRSPLPHPKEPAREAFTTLVRGGPDPETLIEAAERFAAAVADEPTRRYIPYAVNWLKRERFPEGDKPVVQPTRSKALSEAEWRGVLSAYKAGDCRVAAWPKDVGLRPEHPATRVPLTIRREFGFSK